MEIRPRSRPHRHGGGHAGTHRNGRLCRQMDHQPHQVVGNITISHLPAAVQIIVRYADVAPSRAPGGTPELQICISSALGFHYCMQVIDQDHSCQHGPGPVGTALWAGQQVRPRGRMFTAQASIPRAAASRGHGRRGLHACQSCRAGPSMAQKVNNTRRRQAPRKNHRSATVV